MILVEGESRFYAGVKYLTLSKQRPTNDPRCPACVDEILHVRHHSLFVPRDFDVSPYFQVIEPTLDEGFDHHRLRWADRPHALAIEPEGTSI